MDYSLDDPATMALDGDTPTTAVRLPDAAQIKLEAERLVPGGGDWWERSVLTYRAVARCLDVPDGDDRTGLKLPSGKSVTCASLHHSDVQRYHPVLVFWPVTDDPRDYLIAASVRSNDDGTTTVAIFGAMTGDEVRRRVENGPVQRGRRPLDAATRPPRTGLLTERRTDYIAIPLRDFDAGLLRSLTRSAAGDATP